MKRLFDMFFSSAKICRFLLYLFVFRTKNTRAWRVFSVGVAFGRLSPLFLADPGGVPPALYDNNILFFLRIACRVPSSVPLHVLPSLFMQRKEKAGGGLPVPAPVSLFMVNTLSMLSKRCVC